MTDYHSVVTIANPDQVFDVVTRILEIDVMNASYRTVISFKPIVVLHEIIMKIQIKKQLRNHLRKITFNAELINIHLN